LENLFIFILTHRIHIKKKNFKKKIWKKKKKKKKNKTHILGSITFFPKIVQLMR